MSYPNLENTYFQVAKLTLSLTKPDIENQVYSHLLPAEVCKTYLFHINFVRQT